MNSTPFSRAENSSDRESAAPLLTALGATERRALPICVGANALERSRSVTPASSAVTVPALMSVSSPSMRKVVANRARDKPPPPWVPLTLENRT